MRKLVATPTAERLSSDGKSIRLNPIPPNLSKEEYRTLLEISQIITSTVDLEEILDQSLEQVAKVVEASASSIWLVDESKQSLFVASATGEKSEQMKVVQLNVGEGIVGRTIREKKAFITDDARHEKYHAKGVAEMLDYEATTMMCVPMIWSKSDHVHGAIQVINKAQSRLFNDKDLFMLSVVANSIGIAIENAWLYRNIYQENSELRRNLGKWLFTDLIGRGDKMKEVLERASRVAKTNSTVLIRGESGTGKELVAQSIHNASLRKNKPFVPVNCAALPSELLESELFGHEKGAFTGAIARKEGRFELANGGTLFLDEIGDMALGLQAKLLRVLQDRAFYRVGGIKRIICDVRVIAATNQDLDAKMKDGTFREDLYYRLNVITIFLPPLRERTEDIGELAQYFLTKYSLETKQRKSGFTPQVSKMLKGYSWPGNVRELENAIEHAVVLGRTDAIQREDLPVSLHEKHKEFIDYDDSLEEAQRQFKKQHLEKILGRTKGNRSQAAEILQIQRTYLSRLIQ